MSDKKSKKAPKPPTKHSLLGIATNVAAGPLGFRAKLNAGFEDEKNPGSSQVVPNDRQSEPQESTTPQSSICTVVGHSSEQGNSPEEENLGRTRRKDGGLVVLSVLENDDKITAPRAPATPVDAARAVGATDGFGPLKTLLGSISAICTDHGDTVAVASKTEGLELHIMQLDILFSTPPGDVTELRRRDALTSKIEDIEGRLQVLNEKLGQQRTAGRIKDDENVLTPLEDLQEVILDYKKERQTVIHNQELKSMDPAEASVLNGFRCAQQAEYRHGNRNGCLKGTRSAILDEIELWTRDFDKPSVYWLNGLAGTGKSTISQTIAERMFADGRLGASFFCSRDFEDRRNLQFIFPTLAVQLARKYAVFRSTLVPLVRSDPEIANESLYDQMNKLIFQPLTESAVSTVIIIDALDECKDEEPASAILSVLGQFVAGMPKVKFFVTGRPEPRILEGFRLPLLAEATDVFVLHTIELSRVNRDIRQFFTHKFMEIKGRRRGLGDWPSEEQLDILCGRAAGLFVYAVATIRFIDQRNGNPKRQLDRLLQVPGDSVLEGKTKFKENSTLDSLYMTILHDAFGDNDLEDDPRIRSVLGAVVLATNPLSPSAIATLLDLDIEDVVPLLSSVHSLLVIQEDVDHPARPFHKSFPDFIVDPTRCPNPRFCISPSDQHVELLVNCLELMNRKLEQNMCGLPDGILNSEVDDIKERTEQFIDHALQYASRSWHKHLTQDATPEQKLEIIPVLRRFLEGRFLFWLEALSALGATREAVDALERAAKWLDGQPSLDLVNDYLRFLLTFFEVISTSASHIYISALPLSPQESITRKLYHKYARPLARVIRGLPILWDPVIATVHHKRFTSFAAWSPCNKFIAVAKFGAVEILDAVTLRRLSSFERRRPTVGESLSFSPDSRVLAQFGYDGIVTWDLQTGGPAGTGFLDRPDMFCDISSTFSPDGKMVALASEKYSYSSIFICSLSWTHTKHHHASGRMTHPIWTHGECLRFATLKPCTIVIWEVTFTGKDEPVKVTSFPAPAQLGEGVARFLSAPPRLAFASRQSILVWDAQDSRFLLDFANETSTAASVMSFSSDGHFFACITGSEGLQVWRESPVGYILHQRLALAAGHSTVLFSPQNAGSILAFNNSRIYLLPTKNPIPPSTTTPADSSSSFALGFFPNEESVAVARQGSSTVTIFNLNSGNLQTTFSIGVGVRCVGVAGNILVTLSDRGTVITWNISAGDRGSGTWGDANNCVRIATLEFPQSSLNIFFMPPPTFLLISPDPNYIAVIKTGANYVPMSLDVYDVSSGRSFSQGPFPVGTVAESRLRFTTAERQLLCLGDHGAAGWIIAGDGKSSPMELEEVVGEATQPPARFLWESARGYEVTNDGWVLDSTKKRLLWLPHYWRSDEGDRTWHGRFLGLSHRELPEAVILEFCE